MLSSTFTLYMLTLSPISVASSAKTGERALHGPHQGAQKSTSEGFSLSETAVAKLSLFKFMGSLIKILKVEV